MTTIAFDGKTLAVDGQTTIGNFVFESHARKIVPLNVNYQGDNLLAVAICGECYWITKLVQVLKGIASVDEVTEHTCEGIVVGEKHVYWFGPKEIILTPSHDKFLAAGSGQQFALSALLLGLDAIQAVRHASHFDIYTNSNITYEDFR